MASVESICARLCLLSRVGQKPNGIVPLSRATVRRMVRLGAIEGLVLRHVPDIKPELYERAQVLLARSTHIHAKIERYCSQGFEILLPEDEAWPVRLEALGMQMPQYLFVKGNTNLLSDRTVSVAGSRKIEPQTMEIAKQCGKAIADAGLTMVCGGAQGVDSLAQQSLLDAGGRLILVPALPAREILRQKNFVDALERNRLLICCETWPDEAFSAQKALSRNHAIYALGDAALVVASRNGVGGSWRGASDCLRGRYTPVYAVCAEGSDMEGNRALLDLGAKRYDIGKPLVEQIFEEQ